MEALDAALENDKEKSMENDEDVVVEEGRPQAQRGSVESWLVTVIIFAMLAAGGAALYFSRQAAPLPVDQVQLMQLKANEAAIAQRTAQQAQGFELELRVAEDCVKRDGVPLIANGNVGCTQLK